MICLASKERIDRKIISLGVMFLTLICINCFKKNLNLTRCWKKIILRVFKINLLKMRYLKTLRKATHNYFLRTFDIRIRNTYSVFFFFNFIVNEDIFIVHNIASQICYLRCISNFVLSNGDEVIVDISFFS